MRLRGRVAVITGAGSGIGQAIALRFAEEGATVVVAGQRAERLAETVALVEAAGGQGAAMPCDVADVVQVQELVRKAVERYGGVTILVNNAARNRPDHAVNETVSALDETWWAATFAVNVTGAFHCCKYVIPHMISAGGGSIINVASTSGIAGNWNQSAYVASKHALVGLTKSIALDYAGQGIRANAICPGFIETERSFAFSAVNRSTDWRERKVAEIPLGRLGRATEVAALAAFLASEESSYMTGVVIPIDGGSAARRS